MKKNFALILALVMLVVCVLGIMPMADGADGESYKPTIAYSNVNYTEDLVLMFAVPAPAGALSTQSRRLSFCFGPLPARFTAIRSLLPPILT